MKRLYVFGKRHKAIKFDPIIKKLERTRNQNFIFLLAALGNTVLGY